MTHDQKSSTQPAASNRPTEFDPVLALLRHLPEDLNDNR
jgi:hypothetical protein